MRQSRQGGAGRVHSVSISIGMVIAGFLGALGIGALGHRLGWLTLDGAIAAAVVGGCIFGFAGWQGAVVLLLFFVSSSLLSRLNREEAHGADSQPRSHNRATLARCWPMERWRPWPLCGSRSSRLRLVHWVGRHLARWRRRAGWLESSARRALWASGPRWLWPALLPLRRRTRGRRRSGVGPRGYRGQR